MTEYTDLKALERKAYTSYHQDGIFDIFLGLAILTFGIMLHPILIENAFLMWGGISVIWVVNYAVVKRAVTVPRIGYVEFKKSRRIRIIFLVTCLVFLNLGIFTATAFTISTPALHTFISIFLNQYGLFLVAIVVGGLFALFGWVIQINRLIIYGLIAFFAFILTQVFVWYLSLPIIVLGLVIAVTGFVLLSRFLRKYPKVEVDERTFAGLEDEWTERC